LTAQVGVYIPAYNAAPFLDRAIQSVLDQTFDDFELLVLDDASTDHTLDVIAPYLSHPKLRCIRNEKNLGMSRNWNKGVASLNNQYIARLDADDFYESDYLSNAIPVLEANPEVGFVFGGVNWITNEGKNSEQIMPFTSSWVVDGKLFLQNLSRCFMVYGPAVCVRRDCHVRLGGYIENMRIHSDWEMWTRIAFHYKVAYVNEIFANIIRHEENCTSQARRDTRSPDDLSLWLQMLDDHKLPYSLSKDERLLLEAAMTLRIRQALGSAISDKSYGTAIACAKFMLARPMVPRYEKLRYALLLLLIAYMPGFSKNALRGSRYTNLIWGLESQLSIQLPAHDPCEALNFRELLSPEKK